MEFFSRVLSGNSRLRETAREAEQVNQNFKENLDNLKSILESEESGDVRVLLDMVYESSFPEEQVFMKTPSRAGLKSKKELVVRLLIGLDSLGVPAMAEMLVFTRKHGPEEIADSLMTLLDCLSPLLEGKEAPKFSTDDVMDAMDFEWHSKSTSRVGSPLLNAIGSATSSPRASVASFADSPLHPILSTAPYRRTISDRSMLVSRTHELGAKSVLDKKSTGTPRPSLAMSASLKYPSANQDSRFSQPTILETLASPQITQVSTDDEMPSSYSLDTLPSSAEHGLQRRHRRKSSSLQQLFAEDANDELSAEGSVGASTERNSGSNSWRRNSSELKKIITNISSETSASSKNPGLATGDSKEEASVAPDKEFLSSIQYQDKDTNWSSWKGSRHVLPPPPPDEVSLWRKDSGGFNVDLISSNKSADQTIVFPPIHSKSSDIHHGTEGRADATEVSSIESTDLIKSSKSNNYLEQDQKNILSVCDSLSSSSKDFSESLSTIFLQTPQGNKSDATSMPGNESLHTVEQTNRLLSYTEGPRNCMDASSTEEPSEIEGIGYTIDNGMEESRQDANDEEHAMKVEHADGYGASSLESSSHEGLNKGANLNALSVSENGVAMDVFGHGHHRSHSDLTPVRSLFQPESLRQEKLTPEHGRESDSHGRSTDKLRRKFARHLRSLTASMESLGSRGGSADRAVMQQSMPWMRVNVENNQQREEASEEQEKGSLSDASSDKSTSSSSTSSAGTSGQIKALHADDRHLVLHYLEAEAHAVDDNGALRPHEHDPGLQGHSDGDIQEGASQVQSSEDHKEDAVQALSSSDNLYQDGENSFNIHEELNAGRVHASQEDAGCALSFNGYYQDAGHAHLLDTPEEGAGHARTHVRYSSDEEDVLLSSHSRDKEAGHKHTHEEGAIHGRIHGEDAVHAHTHDGDAGHAYLLGTFDPDAGNTRMVDHDQHDGSESASDNSDKISPEGTSQELNTFQWILAPLLLPSSNVTHDGDGQAGDSASLSLEDYKDLDSLGISSGDEGEDKEPYAALSPREDLQTTQKTGDVVPSCPLQGQGQVNSQYESHRDVPLTGQGQVNIQSDSHRDVLVQSSVHGNVDENAESLLSVLSNDAAALPCDVRFSNNNDQSDDRHALHYVKKDEYLQELSSLDASNISTALADCADSKNTIQAPSFPEFSPTFKETRMEQILWSKDDQPLMQEAAEMKDYTSPGEELNAHNSPLDEGGNSSIDTDSVNHISLNQSIKLEMPELLGGDEKKENGQPLDVHVEGVSGPCAVEEHLKISDDHFEKLLSELDAADEVVFSKSGELPLASGTEEGQMGMLDDKMTEKVQVEDSARGLDKEKMRLHNEKVGIVDETLSKENSEEEFLDGTGQFIMGGPRHIPALVENNHMQDHGQACQGNPDIEDVEQSSEEGMVRQDRKGVNEADACSESTCFVYVNPVESHDVALTEQYGGSKETSMVYEQSCSKLDQAAEEGEVTKAFWEASEVVDASDSHPLHDTNIHQSARQISDYPLDGSQCTEFGPAGAELTETESIPPFTGSRMQCAQVVQVVDTNDSRLLHDIQQSAAEQESTLAGISFTVDNGGDGDMRAGFMGPLEDDQEHQQTNKLCHVFPLSNKTDSPAAEYAHLHGHPTSSSTSRPMDQHVLNQPATFSDPTLDKWDMDTNLPRSRGRSKGGCIGKLARGCLPCCTKPHTNS